MGGSLFNALIRTHHITSRKKISRLKKAASSEGTHFVLIRSGGSPGLMYVEAQEEAVKAWVDAVKALKYKDYHLLCRPASLERVPGTAHQQQCSTGGFVEEASVKAFAVQLERRGLLPWWQKAMGFDM